MLLQKVMSQPLGTPKSPSADTTHCASSFLPRDIPYSAAFEDEIASILLAPPSNPSMGISVDEIDIPSLPHIDVTALPLPLSDPRRKYPSPISGLLLTHPNGYLEGGPGISHADDDFATNFIAEHGVRDVWTLHKTVAHEVQKQVEVARERAQNRQRAREKNEGIENEMRAMEEQLQLEMRVLGKARERARERRERGDRKRDE